MTTEKRILALGGLLTILLLAAGGWFLATRSAADPFAPCRKSVVAGGTGQLGGDFTLTDENGARVTYQQVFDRPSLLYFGYTFCPDVCPLDNARNAEAAELLAKRGARVRPVFISVDPKRDTPEVLREFTDNLDPDMLGLTGSAEEIAAVNKLWRNYYKVNDDGSDYYLVDHMTNTFLVLPAQGTVEFFGRDVAPGEMADRVQCFLDAI